MKYFPIKIIPDNTKINFVKLKNYSYGLSILIIFITLGSWFSGKHPNYGIDFVGGVTIEAEISTEFNIKDIRTIISEIYQGDFSVQSFRDNQGVSIKIGYNNNEDLEFTLNKIKNILSNYYRDKINYNSIEYVGGQVGKLLIYNGIKAILLSLLSIMLYVWIRFEWQFGLGVLVSIIHDIILTLGFIIYTGLDFNLSSIAAILTIIGYSVNDSVVIYDRIRENLLKYHNSSIINIINMSINETLSRTILTVLTTLFACISLILFGGNALYSFSIVVFVGIIIGTYSSILIASPILLSLNLNNKKISHT